jgi:hypothetical protein
VFKYLKALKLDNMSLEHRSRSPSDRLGVFGVINGESNSDREMDQEFVNIGLKIQSKTLILYIYLDRRPQKCVCV